MRYLLSNRHFSGIVATPYKKQRCLYEAVVAPGKWLSRLLGSPVSLRPYKAIKVWETRQNVVIELCQTRRVRETRQTCTACTAVSLRNCPRYKLRVSSPVTRQIEPAYSVCESEFAQVHSDAGNGEINKLITVCFKFVRLYRLYQAGKILMVVFQHSTIFLPAHNFPRLDRSMPRISKPIRLRIVEFFSWSANWLTFCHPSGAYNILWFNMVGTDIKCFCHVSASVTTVPCRFYFNSQSVYWIPALCADTALCADMWSHR